MTVHPEDKSLKSVIAACRSEVESGRAYVNGHADGGFTVVAQRTDGWNTKTRTIRVNVWNNGKLLRKAAWLAAAAA